MELAKLRSEYFCYFGERRKHDGLGRDFEICPATGRDGFVRLSSS